MFREKEEVKKWFISHKLEIRDSDIHGIGVFATEKIPKHEVIESAPVVIAHVDTLHTLNEFCCAAGTRHIFMDYVFGFGPGLIAFPLGWSGIYNHRHEPNAFWDIISENELPGRSKEADKRSGYNALIFRTKREIEAGEEITTRYSPDAGKLWFVDDDAPELHFDPYSDSLARPSFAYSKVQNDLGNLGKELKKDDRLMGDFKKS
ncbi:MAG: hypothetical protein CME70_19475 [Halobacteriovorax sp.]|nr:hypothetical protein [Halobacteriovorax sp.]MBK26188.1 hypothetical protein [Halobacteriovorax sp.]|tara:strand:- start:1210 stop:1824 length:615 start_codon:yes stop_codon:yes gene_type:complete